jgi:hypothetical protein
MLESMEETHEQNEVRKFYKLMQVLKTGFQPRTSMCKDEDGKLIGDDMLVMNSWGQYFSELLYSNSEISVSENIVYQGAEPYIEAPTGDEAFEVIRALKTNKPPGEDNISAELITYGSFELWKGIHALI